jgi:hypothetical protein
MAYKYLQDIMCFLGHSDEQQIYIFYCQSQGNANHSEPKLRKSSVNSFRNSLRRGNLFLRRMTLEAVPRIDNYRDIFTSRSPFRPSLDELHDSNPVDKVSKSLINLLLSMTRH